MCCACDSSDYNHWSWVTTWSHKDEPGWGVSDGYNFQAAGPFDKVLEKVIEWQNRSIVGKALIKYDHKYSRYVATFPGGRL